MEITGFRAAFIYNLYTTSTKVVAVDAWVFDPSLVTDGPFGSGDTFDFTGGPAVIRLMQ